MWTNSFTLGRKITEMLMLEKRLQPGQEPGAGWPAKVSQYLEKDSWWCAVFHIPIHLLEKKPVDIAIKEAPSSSTVANIEAFIWSSISALSAVIQQLSSAACWWWLAWYGMGRCA